MGGVPVLLLAAAIGVTYGWQPDGGDGVEYIIQVPPDQMEQLRQSGEISSRIDPRVQGHVSRVVIRVGNGPLPRSTPSTIARLRHDEPIATPMESESTVAGLNSLRGSSSVDRSIDRAVDSGDQALIPIPEMNDSLAYRPVPGTRTRTTYSSANVQNVETESMMKPDANDPMDRTGISLPPSLQEAANLANDKMNQAGNAVKDQMKSTFGYPGQPRLNGSQNLPQHPSDLTATKNNTNSSNANNQVPAFTGMEPTAMTLRGGPTTDPTNPQETSTTSPWYNLNRKKGSTAESLPPNTNALPDRTASNSQSDSSMGVGPNGLGTTPTFGSLPAAIKQSQATSRPVSDTSSAESQAYARQQQQAELYQQQQEYERQRLDQERELARQAQLRQLQLQQERQLAERQTPSTNTIANAVGSQNNSAQNSTSQYTNTDPRLSRSLAATLPPNGWTFDVYGQPLDREGRRLDQYGRLISQSELRVADRNKTAAPPNSVQSANSVQSPNYGNAIPGTANSPGYPSNSMNASTPQTNFADVGLGAGSGQSFPRSDYVASPSDFNPNRPTGASSSRNDSPMNASDQSEVSSSRSETSRKTATQPLNWILFVSIVGNVYLLIWMKNLRHQFRDLVSAKRMGQSTKSSPI
ncbi:hypothetical protein CA13_68260 [Planctomycetes bacterium CA13]|uniref:Uncharacterized protein n=1 Tax=Novipirellula herctigrandis TaxID=2527986 RepID=A0A5C5YN19_9BACT|nr:hypothetical protein CA13_68260 [Planctomycetes bacterium CA13]